MRRMSYVVMGLLLVGIAATVSYLNNHQSSTHSHDKVIVQSSSKQATTNSKNSSAGSSTSGSTTKNSGGQSATNASDPCATIFSVGEARQLLGSSVAADSDNGAVVQGNSITTTICSYHTDNQTARVVGHVATSSVGSSSNIVIFGSGRPSGAATVNGYGSAAFWQADNNQLNVLDNNNWFVITGSNNGSSSQAYAESIAAAANL